MYNKQIDMKKIYLAPQTTLVVIELQQMIANSPAIIGGGETAETSTTQEGGGYMLGRGGSIWDDEE